MDQNEPDIVGILRFWECGDDVPQDLRGYLANASDEITGLREENKHLRRLLEEGEPRF